MVNFKAEIERFEQMGEKSGWTYIFIPQAIAHQIKPDCRKSFRVKGTLDQLPVHGLALVPMGEGDFILALKSSLRKELKKKEGALLQVALEEDLEFKIVMPAEMEECLEQEPHLMKNFMRLPKSHQNYYINWYNAAKTESTRIRRLTMMVEAMDHQMDFGEMLRSSKANKGE
jgi:hypothetical protein